MKEGPRGLPNRGHNRGADNSYMGAINETIVREYFELHGFLVRQYRKHLAPAGREEDDVDFLVLNPTPKLGGPGGLPFDLRSADLEQVERAVVVVKGWHTEVFTPAFLASTPKVYRFLNKRAFQQAVRDFAGNKPAPVILAIPCLPRGVQAREESAAMLKSKGIAGVLCFTTMLADLIARVEASRNYQQSDVLQLLRILKQYELFREPQLELFRRKAPRPAES